MLESLKNFLETTGVARLFANENWWQTAIMVLISFVLVYLAIVKQFEPLLLLPIAIGMLLTNLPGANMFHLDFFIAQDINYGQKKRNYQCGTGTCFRERSGHCFDAADRG